MRIPGFPLLLFEDSKRGFQRIRGFLHFCLEDSKRGFQRIPEFLHFCFQRIPRIPDSPTLLLLRIPREDSRGFEDSYTFGVRGFERLHFWNCHFFCSTAYRICNPVENPGSTIGDAKNQRGILALP